MTQYCRDSGESVWFRNGEPAERWICCNEHEVWEYLNVNGYPIDETNPRHPARIFGPGSSEARPPTRPTEYIVPTIAGEPTGESFAITEPGLVTGSSNSNINYIVINTTTSSATPSSNWCNHCQRNTIRPHTHSGD